MRQQIQQLRPDRYSLTKRGDQFLHLPVLRFRVAACDDRPQSVLGEGSNVLRVAESKERLSDLIRQRGPHAWDSRSSVSAPRKVWLMTRALAGVLSR